MRYEPPRSKLVVLGEVEVEGDVYAGLRETNIFEGAVAEDGESHDGVSGVRATDRSVDGVLHPVVLNALGDTGNIPRITSGKFGTSLATDGEARGRRHRTGLGTVAGGNVHGAALAVGNGICGRRSLVLKSFGSFAGWRRRLELVELGNIRGVGLKFGRLGRLFFGQALGGIDDVAVGEDIRLRHGQTGAGDEIHFDAGIARTTDTAPGNGAALNPNADEKKNGETEMHEDGIAEERLEVEFVGVRSGAIHGSQLVRERSLMG